MMTLRNACIDEQRMIISVKKCMEERMSEWEPHKSRQLPLQHDASNCKANADQDSNSHPPVPPADAEEPQVLSVSYRQVFFLSFCLLNMSRTHVQASAILLNTYGHAMLLPGT